MYDGDNVRRVARRLRGDCEDGVKISVVLEASIGASSSDEIAEATVAIRTDAPGTLEASIAELGIAPGGAGIRMSVSAMPKTAAKKLRRKVSSVLDKRL